VRVIGWLGALAAVFALTQPAVDADRCALGFLQIHAGGIDQFAAWRISQPRPMVKARLGLRVWGYWTAHHLRDREISGAVGQLDDLLEQAVPAYRSRVHIPQRAGAAEFENGESAGGNRFDTLPALSTRKRKKGMPRALGRCKVVRRWPDLLEAGIEALRQHVDIIAERLRGGMKTPDTAS